MDYVTEQMLSRTFQPTNNVGDRTINVILLRGVSNEDKNNAYRILMDKRRAWLIYLTRTQRQWQGKTKNQNRAKNHDSVSIREKYVTCHAKGER